MDAGTGKGIPHLGEVLIIKRSAGWRSFFYWEGVGGKTANNN